MIATHCGHRLSPALELGMLESSDIGQTQMRNIFCALEQVGDRFDGDVVAWAQVKTCKLIEDPMV